MADETLQQLRLRAETLLEADRFDHEALDINSAILRIDPDDDVAAIRSARCLEAADRDEDAAAVYRRLAERVPVAARRLRRVTHRMAEVDLASAFARREGSAALARRAAEAEAGERDLEFQVAARRVLLDRDTSAANFCALGAALRRAGRPGPALLVYADALELDPGPVARVGSAGVLRDLKRFDEATAILRSLLAVQPDDVYAWTLLAAVELDRVDHGEPAALDRAEDCLRLAWRLGARGPLTDLQWRRMRALSNTTP